MKLTWYGTAGLILQEGESKLAFDPFFGILPDNLKKPLKMPAYEEEFKDVKYIFVTHGHFDHIYHLPRLYAGSMAGIYCTKTPARTLRRNNLPKENIRIIAPNKKGNNGPFTIKTWQGAHCKFDAPLIKSIICSKDFIVHPGHLIRLLKLFLTYPENNEILFYEVCCNGIRIQIMGSMNLKDDIDYPENADAVILPLQGRSDLDTYALQLVERLKPKAVYLDHYDNTFPPFTTDVDVSGFIKNVEDKLHIPCKALKKGCTVELNGC